MGKNLDGKQFHVIESGRLSNNWSTQTCGLFALNQALKNYRKKREPFTQPPNIHLEWYTHLEKSGLKVI
jgi:hypothetical protein